MTELVDFPKSGLCDKLKDLQFIATEEALHGRDVYVRPALFEAIAIQAEKLRAVPWRAGDTRFAAVSRFVRFPSNIHVTDAVPAGLVQRTEYPGGLGVLRTDDPAWMAKYREIAAGWGFAEGAGVAIPPDTVGVHLRRQDKVNERPVEGMVSPDEAAVADRQLRRLLAHLAPPVVFIASDDMSAADNLEAFVREALPATTVLRNAPPAALEEFSVTDLCCLARCDTLVGTVRYSGFTTVAAEFGATGPRRVWSLFDGANQQSVLDPLVWPAKRATILSHQGYGDLWSACGLVRSFFGKYDGVTVLAADEGRARVLRAMYAADRFVQIQVAPTTPNPWAPAESGAEACCIVCHQPGWAPRAACNREAKHPCLFVDYTQFPADWEHVKLSAFGGWAEWERNMTAHFISGFYRQYGLAWPDDAVRFFEVAHDAVAVRPMSDVVIHDDPARGFEIGDPRPPSRARPPAFRLNGAAPDMVSMIPVMRGAKELHLLDSSYSVMAMMLQRKYGYFKNVPVYVYSYAGRYHQIYEDAPPNWQLRMLILPS
jgi:hypothetical protein